MAITYEIKNSSQGGLIINIPNWTNMPFGIIKISDQSGTNIYEHNFGAEPTGDCLVIKIPYSDISNASNLSEITVNIDPDGADYGYVFELGNSSNMNNVSNLSAGNWLSFNCPINW